MRLAYLIEDTDLSGGVRVVLGQADALVARGHDVTIVTKGLPVTWRRSRAEWIYVDDFSQFDARDFDFVIATFWTTVEAARNAAGDRAIHLCQGYEGSFAQYAPIKPQIDAAYALPVPKLVVTPYLVDICKQFTPNVTWVGQMVDDDYFRDTKSSGNHPPRVLLVGASQIEVKGIDVGYGAISHARWHRAEFELVRVSPWAPAGDEPLEHVSQFHVALTTDEMIRLMHDSDIVIVTSRRTEGFGLPAAEAMASSVPAILTRIPSFLSFAVGEDFALFGDEDDAIALGDRLIELIDDDDLRRRLGRAGRKVAEQFRSHLVAERIEQALLPRL